MLQYGEDTDIPISSTLQSDALELIDLYRLVTPNDEYQEILTQIEIDINHFAGMTRAEILSEIDE